MIALELIKPTPAFTKQYVSMFKQFRKTYDGTTRTESKNTKELLKIAAEDIENQYVFWILDGKKKIGFCLAPFTWKDSGEITGRYLDTRYILESYRGAGVGSRVLDLLVNEYGVHSVKINTAHLQDTAAYWAKKDFRYAVPAFAIDKTFAVEKNKGLFKEDYLHWYMMHKDDPSCVAIKQEGFPMLDLKEQKMINRTVEEA